MLSKLVAAPLSALLALAGLLAAAPVPAQEPAKAEPAKDKDAAKAKPAEAKADEPVLTRHEVTVGGKPIKYTATAGMMPIKNAEGEVEANIFYMAYTRDDAGPAADRPLMFSFNGGPGSASVWLHLGALGPKLVKMPDEPVIPRPPFRLVDNDASWLDLTDLVFIDPVNTGYSRAAKPELTKKFLGLRGDIDSVGEFIRLYLSRSGRWTSPLYLVGESYGTTRAAGLAGALVERKGIAFNGVILVSSVLNFQTLRFGVGNDLPYVLYLPSYTATAFYHKSLAPDLQKDLRATLDASEKWAHEVYAPALAKGDRLTPAERKDLIRDLARYTGLSERYVDDSELRVEIMRFCKELLRKEKRTVGRLDSRYKGFEATASGEALDNDPSMSAIRAPYTATFNQYVRSELNYKTDVPYFILGEGVSGWDYGTGGNGYADTSDALRTAFEQNPSLRVFVASGFYDLATPYAATEYTFAHMNLDPSVRGNVAFEPYEAGHMMYLHGPSLAKLKADVAKFLGAATPKR